MLTQGDSPMLTKGDSPLQIKANYVFRDRSFSPIELYWEKISVMATYKKNKKSCLPYSGVIKSILILNEVSGVAKPGSFTAILGPSGKKIKIFLIIIFFYKGSGKTSLLNFLSNRMMSENFSYSGSLIINGVKVDSLEKIGNQVGYVMQDDILPTSFTPLGLFVRKKINKFI